MPVADAMRMPGRMLQLGTHNRSNLVRSDEFAAVNFPEMAFVNFGEPPAMKEVLRAPTFDAVGPQILPFDTLWLEGIWPDAVRGWRDATNCAVLCASDMARHPSRLDEPLRSTVFYAFGQAPCGSFVRAPLALSAVIDDNGLMRTFGVSSLADDGNFTGQVSDDDYVWMLKMVLPAMWAIGVMNCKNVSLQEVAGASRGGKRSRRQRRTGVDYRTIVLPGRHGGATAGDGGPASPVPRHRVRGHFKTFTRERPLLGKHVGTYWWGWQIRGSAESGTVISDYKVSAPLAGSTKG